MIAAAYAGPATRQPRIAEQATTMGLIMPRPHALPTAETSAPAVAAHRAPSATWQVTPLPPIGGGRSARRSHKAFIEAGGNWSKRVGTGAAATCYTAEAAALANKEEAGAQSISNDGAEILRFV